MKVYYGATANEYDAIPGWLPIVAVSEKIYGSTYCTYRSGVYTSKEDAVVAACRIAKDEHANHWDQLEYSDGCARCLSGLELARHLVREDDHSITCGHCKRCLE